MSTTALRQQLLADLHGLAESDGYDRLFSLDELAARRGVTDSMKVLRLAEGLEAQGLIVLASTFGGTEAAITGQGVVEVERANESTQLPTRRPARPAENDAISFEDLLHPFIREHAYKQFRDGYLREAVLNAVTAVFEIARQRTSLDLDGDALVTQVLSATKPLLLMSELATESGRNDQIGFMMILQGLYRGVRNPKAHSLSHDLTRHSAAQYLVFASLLARRLEAAGKPAQT